MTFDADFLARLRQRDPATCNSFLFSLTPVLETKLRYEFRDRAAVEDVRNETFCRVFDLVDKERVRDPEHFGGFVRGVCSKVAQEYRRKTRMTEPMPEDFIEPAARQSSIDDMLADEELRSLLRSEITKLPAEEEKLISESYFQGRERQDMARDRGISVVGLNVRLCRALKRLRTQVLERI